MLWRLMPGVISAIGCLAILLPMTASGAPAGSIRIGATVSLSGKFSEPSAMIQRGYRLWEQQVNARGGLLGRPVALVVYDDHSDPDAALDGYHRLVYEDRVDLLFSPYSTPLTLQASQVSEARQMVMLACGAAGSAVWQRGYRFVFGMYAPADRYFIGLLDLMARQGYDSVSIIHENSGFNNDIAAGVEKWARRFGFSTRLNASFPPGQPQLMPLIREAAEKDARGLILSVYPQDGYRMLEQLQAMSWRPRVLGMVIAPTHPDFYRKAGPIAEGVFAPSQWEPDERIPFPGTVQFIHAFEAAYRQMPSYHAGSAYASCQILERAINDIGAIDHHQIRDYISSLDAVTVIGRFKVDPAGRQVGHNPILVQWQDGAKQIVYPTKMQTAPPRF